VNFPSERAPLTNPWTNVYGVGRSIVALSTLSTLLWNDAISLFSPASLGVIDGASLEVKLSCFGMLSEHLELARSLAILAMFVVASGWRPRFTGIIHWWVAWSFHVNAIPSDGGDQVAAIVALLLIPLTLGDPRKWHWQVPPKINSNWRIVTSRFGLASMIFVRIQAAIIYLHAGVGKLYVQEWLNGTALYYWVLDPRVGVPSDYHSWVLALFSYDFMNPLLTWGPMLLEVVLFLGLAMSSENPLRKVLLVLGLIFHAANILFFGLVSFFFSMAGLLILYMRPVKQPFVLSISKFSWSFLSAGFRRRIGET